MQTPLQIANDVVDKHLGIRPAGTLVTFALSLEQIRDMIAEGIDFDQEQRKPKQPTCKHCGLPVRPEPSPDTGLPDWIHLATVTIASQIAAAIEADRAQRTNPVVVIREGIGYEGGDVDIVDLDFIGSWPDAHGDFDQEDIDRMLATLRRGGFTEAAEDLEEWWAER